MPDLTHNEWEAVLDTMERGIATAANAQHDDAVDASPGWHPPSDPGPLPADLVGRARRIQAAQRSIVDQLRSAVRENRQHHALLGAVNASTARPGAVYLDVAG
ncbi:hypothetical protein [Arthrobacter sp. 260]|uniref:hypothetical protein n=1 Tax=Arthrobacter sp. 260 TaxID=2735314 RepID=UPI001490B371|nr:hypothetical protein [Arthrobacter sp. 260]NOJ60497.1 hypothetical protein [Arthrobacter sp. 260]